MIEEPCVPSVLGQIASVSGHGHRVPGHLVVQTDVVELHRRIPEEERRVRVALFVGKGMVLAVNRDPLSWTGTGRYPDENAAGGSGARRKGQRPVGQRPVKVDGGEEERELGENQRDEYGHDHRPRTTETTQDASGQLHHQPVVWHARLVIWSSMKQHLACPRRSPYVL